MRKRILYNAFLFALSIFILFLIFSFKTERNPKGTGENLPESAQPKIFKNKRIVDGPYIFYENENTVVRWVYKNRMAERMVPLNGTWLINRKFNLNLKHNWLDIPDKQANYEQTYQNIENIAVISDMHGQFDLTVKLLKSNHIIDNDCNWNFGNGHLVVLGDIFDRGPKVTELLWFVFRLEKQAELSGGKVHFLLGNHELMVLNNDIRYIHEKYRESSELMGKTYTELFAENTFFGQWLRTKPVMLKINDLLFVHAGVSPEFIERGYTITETNQFFIDSITGKSWKEILENEDLKFLMGSNGLVWFRGYFKDEKFPKENIDQILQYFNVKKIILGHTTLPNITPLFDMKVIGIDAGIKDGDYGEILIYKDKKLHRGTPNGAIIDL